MLNQYGCTGTVLYKLYKQNDVKIDKTIATLMLSAIISDTLLFKSPVCTNEDKKVAEELVKIAEINMEEYGLEMLKAGTDLSDLTADELISLDAKEFMFKEAKTVIAQVNTASIKDILTRKEEIEVVIQKEVADLNLDLFVFAITDIINSNSQVLVFGKRTDIVEKSYNVKLEANTAFLPGVVSRKKQMVPVMTQNA